MKIYTLPTIERKAAAVILANGTFPTHPIPLAILNNCEYLVCCDGAIDKLYATGKVPHAIVGDCDSLSDANKARFADIMHRFTEQETNDLTKAVNFCISQGKKDIIILGATGEREDHTLGNISLLAEYMKKAQVKMVTDHGSFVAIDSDSDFESQKGQQVSIFCVDKSPISSQGLVYEIEDKTFINWWQATLNEAKADLFRIMAKGVVIVYRNF